MFQKLLQFVIFSELCGGELSEGQFARSVNALNHNVLHMCFSQHVNPEELNPRHTMQNVILLLKARHLGRYSVFDYIFLIYLRTSKYL